MTKIVIHIAVLKVRLFEDFYTHTVDINMFQVLSLF